jgi:hypothetical protein
MLLKPKFTELFKKDDNIHVKIDKTKSKKIKDFVKDVVKIKNNESHHIVDSFNEEKRWYTGFSGEAAIEELLGCNFIDFSIGDSKSYHVSDLKSIGLDVGVKTVEYGKFPVVFKKSHKPQIIVIKISSLEFYVCGLATVDVLNKYQSDDLILSPMLRKRGTKSGFYGFNKLHKFNNLEELKLMVNKVPSNTRFKIDGEVFKISLTNDRYNIVNETKNTTSNNLSVLKTNKRLSELGKSGEIEWL